MRSAKKIMKMSPVSLVFWLGQLLTVCATYHNPTTTHGLEVTRNPQLTTENKKLRITTRTAKTTASQASPAEVFLTKWTEPSTSTTQQPSVTRHVNTTEAQRSSPNAEGMENASKTFNNPDHRFVSPISSNHTSTAEENTETGTRSGVFTTGFKTEDFTSQEMDHTEHAIGVNNWESGTSLQTEHTVQTSSWMEESSEATGSQIEADGTTVPLVNLRNKSVETQSDKGSYNSTVAQHGWAHTTETLVTTPIELDDKTSLGNSTVGFTNALPSLKHGVGGELTTGYYVETPEVISVTQVTSSNSENISMLTTEGSLVSTSSANTAVTPVSGTDQKITENVTTTVYNVVETTWTDSVSTQNTERLSTSGEGSYNFTTGQKDHITAGYDTTPTELGTNGGNHTTPGNSTVGMINVPSSEHDPDSQITTRHYITTHMTEVTSSDGKKVSMWTTEEPLVSSTIVNTVSAVSSQSTQRNVYNVTSSTGRDRMTTTEASPTPSDSAWSTFPVNRTITSNDSEATTGNVSREAEWAVWPDCFSNVSSSKTSSRLVCFITLWSLAMTASIFLGLTIFLWVRLSVVRKKAKHRYKGVKATGKERQSLWATHSTPAAERVEFWYANGSTLEADKKEKERGRAKRNGGKQKEGKDEDMWIQPKVTLQDITEFWYANGRGRNEDRTETRQEDTQL